MALKKEGMLPHFLLQNEVISDLLSALDVENEMLQGYIKNIRDELNIYYADKLLSRYERILDVKPSKTRRERVNNLISKLMMKGTTRVKDLLDIIKLVTKRDGEIIEHFSEYRFDVIVNLLMDDGTSTLENLKRQIEIIKPAHLAFTIITFIELIRFINEYEIAFSHLMVNMRNNNFDSDNHYLDGFNALDGSYYLDQNFMKLLKIFDFLIELNQLTKNISRAFIVEDTLYYLNGQTNLNGYNKLNAAALRSEL